MAQEIQSFSSIVIMHRPTVDHSYRNFANKLDMPTALPPTLALVGYDPLRYFLFSKQKKMMNAKRFDTIKRWCELRRTLYRYSNLKSILRTGKDDRIRVLHPALTFTERTT